jgi:hypothetical protein
MLKRELAVARLLEFESTTLPSGLRNGNGLPVYFTEIGSMYFKSASRRRSTTRPRSWASLYGSWKSTIESETRGSRLVFFPLSDPSPVQIKTRSSSRAIQTGTLCGEPSGMRVARWAKLGPSSKALISSESGITMAPVLARNFDQIYHFNYLRGASVGLLEDAGQPLDLRSGLNLIRRKQWPRRRVFQPPQAGSTTRFAFRVRRLWQPSSFAPHYPPLGMTI